MTGDAASEVTISNNVYVDSFCVNFLLNRFFVSEEQSEPILYPRKIHIMFIITQCINTDKGIRHFS